MYDVHIVKLYISNCFIDFIIIMIVLLLLKVVATINISQFTNSEIGFNNNCSEFLLFQGQTDHVYMYEQYNQTEIWISQNQSYSIYTIQPSEIITLQWKNGVLKIHRVLDLEVIIEYPLQFESEFFLCPIIALSNNIEPPLYKCPKTLSLWSVPLYIIAIYIVVLVLYGTIFEQQIPWLSEWGRTIYERVVQRQES